MFIFQTILNVFGSVDLLPLTGVTFPFVSSGGTSMLASWGLLSFLKAADTRQNASFAIRLDKKENSTTNWKAAGWKIRKTFSLQSMGTGAVIRKIATIETTIMPALQALRADLVLPGKRSHGIRNRNDDTTIISSTSSRPKRQVKYENISDDEFFNNLDSIRPGDSFSERSWPGFPDSFFCKEAAGAHILIRTFRAVPHRKAQAQKPQRPAGRSSTVRQSASGQADIPHATKTAGGKSAADTGRYLWGR